MVNNINIRAAHKDYNARGKCREHWFRMLWINGHWEYFGQGRLSKGTYLASERHETIYGDVEAGDIICQHDRGGSIDTVYIVIDSDKPMIKLSFRRRGGKLFVKVPFEETEREYPDPRN